MSNSIFRVIIFWQAAMMLLVSIIWFIKDDQDKWFERWSTGLILLALWSIMNHLKKPND